MTPKEKKLEAAAARFRAERRFEDVLSVKPGFYRGTDGRIAYKHPLYEIVNAKNMKHSSG